MIYTKPSDKRKKLASDTVLISDPHKISDHVTESLQILKSVQEGDYAAISKRLATGQSLMSVREPGSGASIAHVAARCGDKAILKLLVRKYSDYIKMSNNQGRTAVHEAAEQGKFVCLTYLLQHGAICKTRDRTGVTPIMLSAQNGHLQTLRRLALSAPDSISSKDTTGLTALHYGSAAGQQQTVRWLVQFGADDQAKDLEGCSAIHHAVYYNHLKCAIWLQQYSDCDVRHINNKGHNSCHIAAQEGHLDILHWLLSNKLVSPDEPGGKYGSTPVHEAAGHGQLESLRCLKQYGANMHKRNFNDKSPKDIATANKQTECVRYLDSIKKPKHEKKEKRASSLTRIVQALSINGEDKGSSQKTKRRLKGEFDRSVSDNDEGSSWPREKLSFNTSLHRPRYRGDSDSAFEDDVRSMYSNGSGNESRRPGKSFSSWEATIRTGLSLSTTKSISRSNNEIISNASSPASSTTFDIMTVLRDEKRRQLRLKQADIDDETGSLKSSSSYNGRGRSASFLGSQDTMDRHSFGSPFNPCSPNFGYVPSPPPRSVSIEAARSSTTSTEFEVRMGSPHLLSPDEMRSVSDRSSIALSDSSGESSRQFSYPKQPCPLHRPASPARITTGDFKKVFSERQSARLNARCTCRNSGELRDIPERHQSLRQSSWAEESLSPSPTSHEGTLARRANNDLSRLGLDNFKHNWGTKTLLQPGRQPRSSQPRTSEYPNQPNSLPNQNFGVTNGRLPSPLPSDNPASSPNEKQNGMFSDQECSKTYRDGTTFRTSTNLSDICKL